MTLIFSDIHFGLRNNSEKYINIAQNVIEWILSLIKKYNIKNVIFCGDWHHSRINLNVNTFDKSFKAIKRLSESVDNLYIIVGNHDAYYRDNILTNSVSSFDTLNNTKIINSAFNLKLGKFNTVLLPWGNDFRELSGDILFGHFEPNGVYNGGMYMQSSDYNLEDLTKNFKLVFSGHYHRNEELTTKNKHKVIFIGSPYQQNKGDINNSNGCYIFNEDTGEYSFEKNTISPQYKHLYISTILKTKKLPPKKEIVNNNILVTVDKQVNYTFLSKLVQKFTKAGCFDIELNYYNNRQISVLEDSTQEVSIDTCKTLRESITDFIMDNNNIIPENLDRNKLLSLGLELYNQYTVN